MNVLGINSGNGAAICLLEHGKILLAIEEERLTRKKNGGGFPTAALQYAYENYPKFFKSLQHIAFCDLEDAAITGDELQQRYHRRFAKRPQPSLRSYAQSIVNKVRKSVPETVKRLVRPAHKRFNSLEALSSALPGLDVSNVKISRLNHHECHAAAAYFGLAKDPSKPYLVFTLDGGGDRECASISIGKNGKLSRIATTESGATIPGVYSLITYFMGFKPHEHEYKIMGLSPYTPSHYGDAVVEKLKKYVEIDPENPLIFKRLTEEKAGNVGWLIEEDFRLTRFDNLAVGLQRYTEELILQWIDGAIKRTGISDILLSGGVFMNIKMNKCISELESVNSVNTFPSCGDETNIFGAAFSVEAQSTAFNTGYLDRFCLGPNPEFDLEEAKQKHSGQFDFLELSDPANTIATLLSEGHVVARCDGPMEFGARALGNRSLLADPTTPRVVERINHLIKQRDFWMPFAPAVLLEDSAKYLYIPATLPDEISPYMMFGFDTKPEVRGDMAAALHRSDQSARAQIVDKQRNSGFHEVISRFKAITGRSVVLNTSFNLHGSPIVMGTMDAIHVMMNSDLEYTVVGKTLISRRT
mgnify:CR=1 FL=1